MAGDVVASRNHQLLLVIHHGDLRRAVVVGRFTLRVGGALYFPDCLTGVLVNRKNIRRIFCFHAVEDLHIQPVTLKQRRRRVAVIQSEASVVGLDIALPDLGAVHGEAGELTIAGHDPNALAVGDWRRRRGVLLAEELISAVDLLAPAHRAIFTMDGEEENLIGRGFGRAFAAASIERREALFGGSNKDGVRPYDGRCRAPAWQFRAPDNGIGLCSN